MSMYVIVDPGNHGMAHPRVADGGDRL